MTIKSRVIKPLPTEFIQYLLNQDQRFILPYDARTSSALLEANHQHRDDDNDAWSSSCDDSDRENEPNAVTSSEGLLPSPPPPTFSFPELNEQIRQAIQSFPNQACVPKLNWSSPKDAVWINGNTMECRTAGDVYLLCKASDFITFDLLYAQTDVVDDGGDDVTGGGSHSTTSNAKQPPSPSTVTTTTRHQDDDTKRQNHTVQENVDNGDESNLNFSFELVLRKFCNLYPSQEFRCFVSYDTLLGISQRHQHYNFPFLQRSRNDYSLLIYDFYESAIRPNVHRMSSRLQQYVVDLYIDQQQRIWIIDFNVWGTRTDAILFDWSELVALSNQAKLLTQRQTRNHPDDAATEISTNPNDTILRRVDFRIVESSSPPSNNNDASDNRHQQPIHSNPLSNYKAPMDALLLSHHGDATTATTFQDFMKLCVRPSANHNNDDSNDSSSSSESDAQE